MPSRRTREPEPLVRDPRTPAHRKRVVLDAIRPHLNRGAWREGSYSAGRASAEVYAAVERDVRTYLADVLDAYAQAAEDDPVNDLIRAISGADGARMEQARALGGFAGRDREVARLLADREVRMLCWGVNGDGSPRHPLYLPGDTPLVPWTPPVEWGVVGRATGEDGES